MTHENQVIETYHNNTIDVLAGLLIGSLAGALAMLLIAPQSGKATRTQIQEKGIELRDQAGEMLGDAITQVRLDRKNITLDGRQKAKELFQKGQALVIEQLENVSETAPGWKKGYPKRLNHNLQRSDDRASRAATSSASSADKICSTLRGEISC